VTTTHAGRGLGTPADAAEGVSTFPSPLLPPRPANPGRLPKAVFVEAATEPFATGPAQPWSMT
jgi:hypothetical protein